LQIYIEYNDRYAQASTYHQLGRVAEEQQQWKEASKYFLQSLEIDATYNDTYNMRIDLRSLARLWKASGDANLPVAVAPILGASVQETEKLLREMLGEQ
jgi:tetratricopeptide (TPR) repeat protein